MINEKEWVEEHKDWKDKQEKAMELKWPEIDWDQEMTRAGEDSEIAFIRRELVCPEKETKGSCTGTLTLLPEAKTVSCGICGTVGTCSYVVMTDVSELTEKGETDG